MFHILHRVWPHAMRAEAAETEHVDPHMQARAAAPCKAPGIRQSRLDYVRRVGPVMGMCFYQLDASLRASGGSVGGVISPQDDSR